MRKLIGLAALTLATAFSTLSMPSPASALNTPSTPGPASATTRQQKAGCTDVVDKLKICHQFITDYEIAFHINHEDAFGDTLKVDIWSNLRGDFDSREVVLEPPSTGLFLSYKCNTNGEYFKVEARREGKLAHRQYYNCPA